MSSDTHKFASPVPKTVPREHVQNPVLHVSPAHYLNGRQTCATPALRLFGALTALQIADQKAQGLGQFSGALVIAHDAEQRTTILGIAQYTADPRLRAVIVDIGVGAIDIQALVSDANLPPLATHFFAQQQLSRTAHLQLVKAVLTARLTHLIGGAQGVAVQQTVVVGQQGLTLTVGQVQGLEFGQIGDLFSATQTGRGFLGVRHRHSKTETEQCGEY